MICNPYWSVRNPCWHVCNPLAAWSVWSRQEVKDTLDKKVVLTLMAE